MSWIFSIISELNENIVLVSSKKFDTVAKSSQRDYSVNISLE